METLAAGGHFDQAIHFLQAELAKDSARRDLQLALGNIAMRAGNYDLAVGQFQAVAKTSIRIPMLAATFTFAWASRSVTRVT